MRVFHHKDLNRIDVLDERFYTMDNVTFYPSVTTVLSAFPKPPAFHEWLKINGHKADEILQEAADKGTTVHNAIEDFNNGLRLEFIADSGNANFSLHEWQMLCRYMDFFYDYIKPGGEITSEALLFSDFLKVGGTADIVCEINGETWLIDVKTGKGLYKTHEIQLAVYKTIWDEKNTPKIDRYGILWLNSSHRSKKQFQGNGWVLKELTDGYMHDMKLWQHTRALWDEINPNYKPKNLSYPGSFQREEIRLVI